MLAREALSMAHASAVRARGSALPSEGLPPGEILDSWVRCMAGGLDPGAAMSVPVVSAADLALRRERSALVRRLAQAELETLAPQIAGSNFLLAFADHDGVILDLYADNRFQMSGSGAGIVAGSCWDERAAGTNGLGTALAVGRSVAVTGLEHFYFNLGDLSCTAAPVRDAAGDLVGVLDASSYFESRQRHTQALVQMAATHIENGLLLHQTPGQTVLAVHPRAEFLGTLSAGLLAFDDDGRLGAVNARAASLLSGLSATRGTAYEDLFGEPFERLLARLHVGHEVRLRDVLGSSLMASVVRRPAPRGTALDAVRAVDPVPASRAAAPLATRADTSPADRRATPDGMAARPAGRALGGLLPRGIVVGDAVVAEAFRRVRAAVGMNVPILIEGQSGSGKELLARHAHECSGRRGPFVAVNCAALRGDLLEAELFGAVDGAGHGPWRDGSVGLIAGADGGTLLLDDVRELPLPLQAALLRFLDDRMVRPVGGTQCRSVDVQLLAATRTALEADVAAGCFRDDLRQRLEVVNVRLPPLRGRSDFADAVRCTLAAIDPLATLDDGALEVLRRQRWPGNFRELRAVLTRALLGCRLQARPARIGVGDLEALVQDPGGPAAGAAGAGTGSALRVASTERVRREFERCGRSVSRTARSLGISRTTVYRHLGEAGGSSVRECGSRS